MVRDYQSLAAETMKIGNMYRWLAFKSLILAAFKICLPKRAFCIQLIHAFSLLLLPVGIQSSIFYPDLYNLETHKDLFNLTLKLL
jgi:hypothetical protein